MDKHKLEEIIRQVLLEQLGGGVQAVRVPALTVTEAHRMNTGNPGDKVYTRDLSVHPGAVPPAGGRHHGDDRHHLPLDPEL